MTPKQIDMGLDETPRKTFIGKNMVRFNRGRNYVTIVQFIGVIVILIRGFDTTAIFGYNWFEVSIIVVPALLISMWLLGWADEKYGWLKNELKHSGSLNPLLLSVYNKTLGLPQALADIAKALTTIDARLTALEAKK